MYLRRLSICGFDYVGELGCAHSVVKFLTYIVTFLFIIILRFYFTEQLAFEGNTICLRCVKAEAVEILIHG